ncbi:hypothetical protein, partial [Desulfocurvus sp. DL9XJH121]
ASVSATLARRVSASPPPASLAVAAAVAVQDGLGEGFVEVVEQGASSFGRTSGKRRFMTGKGDKGEE